MMTLTLTGGAGLLTWRAGLDSVVCMLSLLLESASKMVSRIWLSLPQGLKPRLWGLRTARLKPCPSQNLFLKPTQNLFLKRALRTLSERASLLATHLLTSCETLLLFLRQEYC